MLDGIRLPLASGGSSVVVSPPMNTTYTPWVEPCKYLKAGSPRPNSRGYMIMLVIPMDLVNLHEVANPTECLNWYPAIPDLV